MYKCLPISSKLGQNLYEPKISDEFDYGSNWTQATSTFALQLELVHLIWFTL